MLATVQFRTDPFGLALRGERYALVTSGAIAPRREQIDIPIVAGAGLFVAPLAAAPPAVEDAVLVCWQGALLAGRWHRPTARDYWLAGSDPLQLVRLPRGEARLVGVVRGVSMPMALVDQLWTPELRAAYWRQPKERRARR